MSMHCCRDVHRHVSDEKRLVCRLLERILNNLYYFDVADQKSAEYPWLRIRVILYGALIRILLFLLMDSGYGKYNIAIVQLPY